MKLLSHHYGVTEGVIVGVGVPVGVTLGVAVGVTVTVGDTLGVAVGVILPVGEILGVADPVAPVALNTVLKLTLVLVRELSAVVGSWTFIIHFAVSF